MEGIIVDKRVAQSLIHHYSHMDSWSLIPESILSMEFVNKAGNKMSYRNIVECQKERLSAIVHYLKVCLESQPAERSNAETLAQHTTGKAKNGEA